MKTNTRTGRRRFQLRILGYGYCYYIDRVAQLEAVLAARPRTLQIDLVGVGEINPDAALRIRAALLARARGTRVTMQARSSLINGSVLVWLLGDRRLIRDDARLFFRPTTMTEEHEAPLHDNGRNHEPNYRDSVDEIDPEEGDYARVLQCINEYLPVKELAGRFIGVHVLRQYGLVDHEQVDNFLSTAFATKKEPPNGAVTEVEEDCRRGKARAPRSQKVRK